MEWQFHNLKKMNRTEDLIPEADQAFFFVTRQVTGYSLMTEKPSLSASFAEAVFDTMQSHLGISPFCRHVRIKASPRLVPIPLVRYSSDVWISISASRMLLTEALTTSPMTLFPSVITKPSPFFRKASGVS